MNIRNVIKRIFIVFIALLMGNISQFASADSLKNIQQKHQAATAQIKRLRSLENLEKNKLYKNQQKLEQASSSLQKSQNQYSSLESQLSTLQHDLNTSVAEFNGANVQMKNRIRQVYKHQRKGMFQLIFTAKDLNSLLDVVYFERIVLKRDYQRMMAVKAKADRIARMKREIIIKKAALARSIQDINYQQKKY